MNIDEIILLDVNRVIQSPDLLKVVLVSYKELFNIKDNQINASCERCLRDYYNQVKIRIMSKDKTVNDVGKKETNFPVSIFKASTFVIVSFTSTP